MSALTRPSAPFIGRQRVLRDLRDLLVGERLVTLVGASGLGKTRTAIELAETRAGHFAGGVVRVDLTETRDASGVRRALATALGAVAQVERAGQAAEGLRRRGAALVLLDNFEQVAFAASDTVGVWLARCPEARFLVTSRERLRLPGEVTVELPPLSLPDGDDDDCEALHFWIAARRRSDPRYQMAADERAVVADIVRQLDGIPLALELAAARCQILGPRELRTRLGESLEVLGRGARDAPERQATMEGAIAWSWNLLAAHEQAALAQCSLFRGGFTVPSAEAVLALGPDAPAVLDVLHALRDKSLVRSLPPAPGTDAPRLGMFQSIRAFAAARLDQSGDAAAACQRFDAHFAALAERLDDAVYGPDGPAALHALAAERENLTAVAHRVSADDADSIARAVTALTAIDTVLWSRGPVTAHLAELDAAIDAAERAPAAPAVLQRALELRGQSHAATGDLEPAIADLERAVALAEQVGEPRGLARALKGLAWARMRQRDIDDVERLLERARALAHAAGDLRAEGVIAGALGAIPTERGDFAGAYARYQEALELHQRAGNRHFEGVAYTRLALLGLQYGHTDEVRRTAARALAIHRAFESRYTEGLALIALGAAEHAEGQLEEARRVYHQAIPLHVAMGERRVHGCTVGYLGVADFELGDVEPAMARLDQAIDILRSADEHRHVALFLSFRAAVAASVGQIEAAGAALEEARGLLALYPHPRFPTVADLVEGIIDLAAAKHAAARGEGIRTTAAAGAREHLHHARTGDGDQPAPASRSVDVRLAARLLERELAALEASGPASAGALLVHPGGAWFAPPGGERIDCRRRHAIRRLMIRLARQRIDRPGVPLDADALVETGWPGERMSVESAHNRLHVTLNRLRNLGLREILVAADGGYFLDPALPVRLSKSDE